MNRTALAIVLYMLVTLIGREALAKAVLQKYGDELSGSKAGTAQTGDLWFWDGEQQSLTMLRHDGAAPKRTMLPASISVDADETRGVAALTNSGKKITIVGWDGRIATEMDIAEPAGDIAWLEGSLLATSPKFAAHRISIWDINAKALVSTVDEVLPISQSSGIHVARATLLRYDKSRAEIVALDATFGQIFVYGAGGRLLRQARLPVPRTQVAEWFSDPSPEELKSTTTLSIWRFASISIDGSGDAWVQSDHKTVTGAVTLFRYSRKSGIISLDVRVGTCRGNRTHIWHDSLVIFRDPGMSEQPCAAVVQLTKDGSAAAPYVHYMSERKGGRPTLRRIQPNATGVVPQWMCMSPSCGCAPPPPGFDLVVRTCTYNTAGDPCSSECIRNCDYVPK